ncbi:fam-j protein, partial [Plasmodium relictum]
NICISQELQEGNPYLFLEEISSNIHTRENSPSMRNFIDAVNIEKDEILSTLSDSQIQPVNLHLEHENSTIHTETESSSISLMGTENVEYEDYVELQNALGGILRTLPDSQIPFNLPLEYENSTIHTEIESSSISLMGTENEKHKDSYNSQPILNYSSVTSNYLKGEFLNLLSEDQCSTINYEDIIPTTSNLMIPENVGNEEYIELQIIPVDFPIEKHATTINYNEDMSSVDEIEQISGEYMGNEKNEEKLDEQIREENIFEEKNFFDDLSVINSSIDISSDNKNSYKKKGKKRSYEDIDNLGDHNIEEDICIEPKKNYVYNQIAEDFVLSLSNIFKIQINCLPDNVVPSLQKLRDILSDDNKSTNNNIEKKININILPLREIITEEIKKINPSDLRAIKEYYDKNIEGEKLLRIINNNILLFRHKTNHKFNIKAMYERINKILKIFEDLAIEHENLRDLYNLKSAIVNNLMYNKLFSIAFIQPSRVFKRIFEILKCMDKLIECSEKSIKNGFKLIDCDYFRTTQKIIFSLHKSMTATIASNLIKIDDILKTLNLSYKDHDIIVKTIFYFFKKENVKNKEKLKLYINKPYEKNSLEAIYNFLLEEEKNVTYYYNEAFKIFNLNLSDKNRGSMIFDDLINNRNTADSLFSLYETLIKLIGGLFFKKQLTIIMNIRRSLLNMSLLRKRKNISDAKNLNKEHQLDLLSQIEKEKCKMEKIKLNIRNLYLLVTTKNEIKRIQVSSSLINKINEIISILRFICKIKYKDIDKIDLNKKKRAGMENILLALYYANQRLSKFTESEIQ